MPTRHPSNRIYIFAPVRYVILISSYVYGLPSLPPTFERAIMSYCAWRCMFVGLWFCVLVGGGVDMCGFVCVCVFVFEYVLSVMVCPYACVAVCFVMVCVCV